MVIDYIRDMKTSDLKMQLLQLCEEYVEARIERAEEPIKRARNAANSESKSSAGDKHETTQAMAHLEQEKNAKQLGEALKLKRAIVELKNVQSTEVVDFGSLVETNKGFYYIGLSIGAVKLKGENYFVIAPTAPIALSMKGLKAGDSMVFNGNKFEIISVR